MSQEQDTNIELSSNIDSDKQLLIQETLSTKRKICMGIAFSVAYLGWGLLLGLQAPFYPKEAELKGATSSQYGSVFGTASLAAFIFSTIFGKFSAKIGPKLVYNIGAFAQAIIGIIFGFLKYVQDVTTFLGLSYLLRFLDGIADATAACAGVSILMTLFPNKVSQTIAWTQTIISLGCMIGPAVGSFLYQLGGFLLPFLCVGFWCLIGAFGILFTIPTINKNDSNNDSNDGKKLTILGLLKDWSIFLPIVDNFLCYFGTGAIESMLEPHIRSIGATQFQVGLTFAIYGGIYVVSALLSGYICDRVKYPTSVSIIGNACMVVSFIIMGPVPFINIEQTIILIQISITIFGFGYALVVVSTFGRAQSAALQKGFKDDIETYLLISGLWSASFYLGFFLGPTFAGISVENFGFRSTTIAFLVIYCLSLTVDVFDFVSSIRKSTMKMQVEYITFS